MKPMALNLSKMKKIAGDEKSSTFVHPSGHKMVIAHSGVSHIQRKQLEQLPIEKMADGGEALNSNDSNALSPAGGDTPTPSVPDPDQSVDPRLAYVGAADLQKEDANTANAKKQWKDGADLAAPVVPSPSADSNGSPPDRAPSGTAAPLSAPQSGIDLQGAYNQGQRAIDEKAAVEAQQSKANQAIQENDVAARQSLADDFKNNQAAFMKHQQDFMNDYANNHIDPRHYQENMSTGSKIASAIGLFLGGAGSATTGSNPALDFLNKQIDRDISGQQSRIDQQKTLLGANQEMYHDQLLSQNQTRANMNDIYDRQIQLAATKLGTPQAKALADQAHSQFALQNSQLLQQNALRATVLKSVQQGGHGLDAMDLAHAGFMSPEQAEKEQSSLNQSKAAVAQANNLFDQLDKEQSAGNSMNPQSYARVKQLGAQITPLVMDENPSKRLTTESYEKEIAPFIYSTGATKETRQAARQGVLNLIKAAHDGNAPTMAKYAPGSLPNYSAPGAGSSAQIQTKNGVQYQKVSGGWKKVQ